MMVEERCDYEDLGEEEVKFLNLTDLNLMWASRPAHEEGGIMQTEEFIIDYFSAVRAAKKQKHENLLRRQLFIDQ